MFQSCFLPNIDLRYNTHVAVGLLLFFLEINTQRKGLSPHKDVSGCKVKCDLFHTDVKFREKEKSVNSQHFLV